MSVTEEEKKAARELFMQAQLLFAGAPIAVAWMAASDLLAGVIGLAAKDVRNADRMVDQVRIDLKQSIRRNWDVILLGKSQMRQQVNSMEKKPS